MFRALLYLIGIMLVLSVIRSVMGIISKAFPGMSDARAGASRGSASPPPAGGELKKDPVCGTFISTSTAFQKFSGGQTYYFCSVECRDKYKG